ncbi:MAG: hypothetical protein KDE27_12760 [Planctomycetes bacterium]|nr:hypothetical protein [Planctomycetota bacterium]
MNRFIAGIMAALGAAPIATAQVPPDWWLMLQYNPTLGGQFHLLTPSWTHVPVAGLVPLPTEAALAMAADGIAWRGVGLDVNRVVVGVTGSAGSWTAAVASDQRIGSIPMVNFASRVAALADDGDRVVWCESPHGQVGTMDKQTGAVTTEFVIPSPPTNVRFPKAIATNGRFVYVATIQYSPDITEVMVFDRENPTAGATLLATIAPTSPPTTNLTNSITFGADGTLVLVGVDIVSVDPWTGVATTLTPIVRMQSGSVPPTAGAADPFHGRVGLAGGYQWAGVGGYDVAFWDPVAGLNPPVLTLTNGHPGTWRWPVGLDSNSGTRYFEIFGAGCPGPLGAEPRIRFRGLPALGSNLALELDAAGVGSGLLLTGLSRTASALGPLPYSLAPFQMPGCFVRVSPDATSFAIANPAGLVATTWSIPNSASLAGLEIFCQYLAQGGQNPVNLSATDGVVLRLR